MRIAILRLAVSFLILVVACSAPTTARRATPGTPMTIPAGERFWVYTAERAELRDENGPVQPPKPLPVGAGLPIDASLDIDSGWGVVAYEHKLGVVQLAEDDITWHDYEGAPIERVSVHGDLFSTLAGDEVTIWHVSDGRRVGAAESARPWLEGAGLQTLRLAVPLGESELLLVGHRTEVFAVGPKTILARVDTSPGRGNWAQLGSEDLSNSLHDLDVVNSDGAGIYLAGKIVADRGRAKMTPDQCLMVVRYDLGRREVRTIVRDDRLATSTHVWDVATGQDLVATLLDEGILRVYRTFDRGAPSALLLEDLEQRLPEGSTLGWLARDRVVTLTPDGISTVRSVR